MGMRYDQLPPHTQRRVDAALAADGDSGGGDAQPKRGRRVSLGRAKPITQLVDVQAPRVLVRITRFCPCKLDDDNLSGGCKQLRDAIAEALGFPGDSAEDGMRWEYRQEPGQARGNTD